MTGPRWPDKGWPKPKDDATARDYLAAYERLKLEMDRMKKHGDELDFFVLELQCRRVILGFWRGIPIAAYGFLCDYGRSFIRPLGFLVIIGISGAVLIRAHFGGGWALATFTDHGFGGGAVGLSFANTFGILGISRDLIGPSVVQRLPGWLKVVLAFQTVFGIGLLFLFGLAIRNRFRMR